jgi:hypothetical protein
MDHIGIDIHKVQSQVCILTGDGERFEQRTMTSGPQWRCSPSSSGSRPKDAFPPPRYHQAESR